MSSCALEILQGRHGGRAPPARWGTSRRSGWPCTSPPVSPAGTGRCGVRGLERCSDSLAAASTRLPPDPAGTSSGEDDVVAPRPVVPTACRGPGPGVLRGLIRPGGSGPDGRAARSPHEPRTGPWCAPAVVAGLAVGGCSSSSSVRISAPRPTPCGRRSTTSGTCRSSRTAPRLSGRPSRKWATTWTDWSTMHGTSSPAMWRGWSHPLADLGTAMDSLGSPPSAARCAPWAPRPAQLVEDAGSSWTT